MAVSIESIKELRDRTSASISDCQKAYKDAGGDIKKAIELIRKRGLEIAANKRDRAVKDGRIEAYLHMGNKVGVLLEVCCETDFVARNEDFCKFTKDIAMHITALAPSYLRKEDVPKEVIDSEKNKEQFYKDHCLLEQAFVKDAKITVSECLDNIVAKMGENIIIRRFTRFKLGE